MAVNLSKLRDRTELKIAVVSAQERSRSIFYRYSGVGGRFLYRLLNPMFNREIATVHHGIAQYYRHEAGDGARFKLRRNVHMIEKGLVMRPRREKFAVDYIEETISELEKLIASPQLSPVERDWIMDVLTEYFEATASSGNARIENARRRFDKVAHHRPEKTTSFPYAVGETPPAVSIEQMRELAYQRTSVRWFQDKPVPGEVVDNALEVALQSPTACNRIPWSLRVFNEPEDIQRIGSIAMGTRGFIEQVPGLAVVVGDLSAYFNERDRHLIYIDSSLGSMSFIFGLQAQGVSSCCINWPDIPEREARMAAALKLAPHERVIMLVIFGYADKEGLTPYSGKIDFDQARRLGV